MAARERNVGIVSYESSDDTRSRDILFTSGPMKRVVSSRLCTVSREHDTGILIVFDCDCDCV